MSITFNPLLFRLVPRLEALLARWPELSRYMNRNSKREGETNAAAAHAIASTEGRVVVILGYGPVGRSVDAILRERGVDDVIVVDMNMDTVQTLTSAGRAAIYGDGYNIEVLAQAVSRASMLIVTLPHSTNRGPLIAAAKLINPAIKVFVRSRYISDADELRQVGADAACYEEAEVAVALSRLVLTDDGADSQTIRQATARLRNDLNAEPASR